MSSPSPRHARFVTACQQLLALGVVCAALTPAAMVMDLELVPEGTGSAGSGPAPMHVGASMSAYTRASQLTSAVPTGAVEPTVREVPLTAPAGARVAPGALAARSRPRPGGASRLTSTPQRVTGYGTVGVTWGHGQRLGDDDISVRVRTRDAGGDWSGWTDAEYAAEHGPDPGSAEARRARPGTDELLVGDVDEVQVQVDTSRGAPSDMQLAVIDPGTPPGTARERASIDTGTLDGDQPPQPAGEPAQPAGEPAPSSGDEDGLDLQAATFTPKPQIFSRAQWGADERMRDAGSLHYYEVHAGFVHHTVNANDYSAADVPAILRGIYAYHTRSKGWSDIGYNYLVDRFGRIWEGRYGGVDRPVVGAHTLGYNDDAFAMSAIGNFETARPTAAMVQAYGALFAWKLSLHGVSAASTKQYVTSRYFQAVNGHRDAGQTACPGRYLYARIPRIRELAAQAQQGWSGRQLESDIAATDLPDIVVRRKSDGAGFVVPLKRYQKGTAVRAARPIRMRVGLRNASKVLNAGDWDRDGHADLVVRRKTDGALFLRRGLGTGRYTKPTRLATGFSRVGLLSAVGDMTGDGYPDLMGQPRGGAMMIYPGRGTAGLGAGYVAHSRIRAGQQLGIGRWDADGAPDTLLRSGSTLSVYAGNGPGGLMDGRRLGIDLSPYDWVVGISDVDITGHPDLLLRKRGTGELYLVQATARGLAAPVLVGTGFDAYDAVG